jgi:serine/threonine protein phosphatase PrpC
MRVATAQFSRPGGRSMNEDTVGWHAGDPWHCWAVADGLGGHGGGEHASRFAVDTVLQLVARTPSLRRESVAEYVEAAHQAIRDAQQNGGPPGMHSTIALLVTDLQEAVWAHVGDSRVYHFRAGELAQQTADHSVPQMLLNLGEIGADEVRLHKDRSSLTRALGQERPPQSEVASPVRLQPGDAFLLCSDGWWEYVTEPEMEFDLAKSNTPQEWLDFMVDRILGRAGGEFDNYSALSVFVGD